MNGNDHRPHGPFMRAALQLALFVLLVAGATFLSFRGDEPAPTRPDELNALAAHGDIPQADQSVETEPASAFDGDAIQVSPNGNRLAFLRGERFQRDIWIAPLASIDEAQPLGLAGEQGVLQFEWALDSAHIIFRRPFDVLNQVYTVDVETGETMALNSFADTVAGNITLSPRHPHEALMRLAPSPEADPELYLVNLVSGELNLIEPSGTVGEFYADEDFVVRAGRTLDTRGFTIFARNDTGWDEVRFVAREPGEQAGVLYLGAARNRIYVLDDEGRETIALSSIDLATGERDVIAAAEDGDVAQVLRDPASSDIFAYAIAQGEGVHWYPLDPALAEDVARLNAFPGGAARVLSQSLDNGIWTIEAEDGFYVFDRERGTILQITS